MTRKTSWLRIGLPAAVGLAGLASAAPAHASHYRYGTIDWAPTQNAGEVAFRIKVAARRSFYGSLNVGSKFQPIPFEFGDGGYVSPLFTVTSVDPNDDWVIGEALVKHTYSGTGPYFAQAYSSARLSNLANRPDGGFCLQTLVRPRSGNSSPASSLLPIVTVPASGAASFYVPAADADGDTLRWRLSTNAEALGYNSTSSRDSSPANLAVDPNTGLVTWDNRGLTQTNPWTVQVVVEDLDANGNVKSKVPVDFILRINNSVGIAPELHIHPHLSGPINAEVGKPVSLSIEGSDDDANDVVTLNASGMPAGATVSPSMPLAGAPGKEVASTFNWTPAAGQAGTYVVSFSATDRSGLQTLGSVTINVTENQKPIAKAGADQTIEADGAQTAVLLNGSGSYDPEGDALTFEWSENGQVLGTSANLGLSFGVGTHTVTLKVKDAKGAFGTDTVVIKVADTAAPEVTVPGDMTVEAAGPDGAVVQFAASANDKVDGNVAVTSVPASGSLFPLGETVVTVSAVDAAGNRGQKSFTVKVVDTTAPGVSVPADITVEAAGPDGAAVSFQVGGSDAVDQEVEVSSTKSSGSTFPLGETEVTVTAVDDAGNRSSKTFKVKVVDTTAPELVVPNDITVEATSAAGAAASFAPTATDLVDRSVEVSSTPASGSTFPLGSTDVVVTATDDAGNTTRKSFKVNVVDTTAPTISGVSVDKPVLLVPNHKMVDVIVRYDVSDNHDAAAAITRSLSVRSNEAQNGLGDGDTDGDWEIVGPNMVRLRAERAGNGSGRVYTITITATDRSGNASSQSVTVSVPKAGK